MKGKQLAEYYYNNRIDKFQQKLGTMTNRLSILLPISLLIAGVFLASVNSVLAAIAGTGITISRPSVNGNLQTGSSISVSVKITNSNDQQPCVVIFEIRDDKGITQYLELVKGTLQSNSQRIFNISWTPQNEDKYKANVFVISSLVKPSALTNVESTNFEVSDQPLEEQPEPEFDSPILNELKRYALKEINEDRKKFDLMPVELGTNDAAQIHAEDVLKTRQLSHWLTNGEKPYMTYSRYGGQGHVTQNVAFSGYTSDYEACVSGMLFCERTDPYEQIDRQQYAMMYEDEECCQNGHRDNILDVYHTHVSIGIAYDDYNFVMVQNFENIYIESDNNVEIQDSNVELKGVLTEGSVYAINILYDELPAVSVYEENKNKNYYEEGELIAIVAKPPPPGYYYENPEDYDLIVADIWEEDNQSIDIRFDLSSVMEKEGVYTVNTYISGENGSDDHIVVTSYSIFKR